MLYVLVKRLALSVPVVVGVSVLTFVLTGLTPGDPAREILGTNATPAGIAAIHKQLGLDHSIVVQYWDWLSKAIHGNLGTSIFTGQPVSQILAAGLPITITLVIGGVIIAVSIGIPLGVISARRAVAGKGGGIVDVMSVVGYAIPPFFLGLILSLIFATGLGVLPASGWISPSQSLSGWLRTIVLPVVTLGAPGAALVARQTRQGMIDSLGHEFIRSLRARGIPTRTIVWKHALRNAVGDTATLVGLYIVSLLLGATLVENVYAMQGLGTLAVQATSQHDLPVLEGAALYFTLIVVISFILIDLLRAYLNPKLRDARR
jgi:peptide/nickel transport system permease protein